MAKYDGLRDYLSQLETDRWGASFKQIENILQSKLPNSAYQHTAWWANQNGSGHSQCKAWLDVGWRVENLSLNKRLVTFRRHQKPVVAPAPQPPAPASANSILKPSYGSMQLDAFAAKVEPQPQSPEPVTQTVSAPTPAPVPAPPQKMAEAAPVVSQPAATKPIGAETQQPTLSSLSAQDAKAAMARFYGLPEDNIQIIIRV